MTAANNARKEVARRRAEPYRWIFEREKGQSAAALARKLNPDGHYAQPTPSGRGAWTTSTVIRIRATLGLLQHQHWNKRWGSGARRQAKASKAAEAAKRRALTKAESSARFWRGLKLKDLEGDLRWLMEHPEPLDWPDGSARYSKREGIFIMRDGSGMTQKSPHKPIPAKPEVMRRRRNYSAHLKAIGAPGVYFPLTREQAEGLLRSGVDRGYPTAQRLQPNGGSGG